MKQAILVLGMHRSGTSAVAGSLILQGASGPRTQIGANDGNPRGHFESSPIARLNDRLLNRLGSSWYDWRRIDPALIAERLSRDDVAEAVRTLHAEYGDAGTVVVKDPRICRLLPFWRQALADAGFEPAILMPVRRPIEVATSLQQRNGYSLETGMWLWLRHVLEAERETRDLPRHVFLWERYLDDWRHVMGRARKAAHLALPVPAPSQAHAIDGFIEPALRHAGAVDDHPGDLSKIAGMAIPAYDAMKALAVRPSKASLKVLDRTLADFNAALAPFDAPAGDLFQAIDKVMDDRQRFAEAFERANGSKQKLLDMEAEMRRYKTKYAEARQVYNRLKARSNAAG